MLRPSSSTVVLEHRHKTADASTLSSPRRSLSTLLDSVRSCSACPSMCGKGGILRVVGGRVHRSVMFVAEAPGRLGALKTGLPLSGDATGENFEELLRHAGWTRREVWVTNAVLCWPSSPEGNNRTPHRTELTNCAAYLRAQIALVRPEVVVPLGAAALAALHSLSPLTARVLGAVVGRAQEWDGRFVFPLYHPSPRVVNTRRSMDQQRDDFRSLRRFVIKVNRPSAITLASSSK